MNFFENFDDSTDVDFLKHVQKTQTDIGNLKEGEQIRPTERRISTFGFDDGDEEDDFFKEFDLEDLDAPCRPSDGTKHLNGLPSFDAALSFGGPEISTGSKRSSFSQKAPTPESVHVEKPLQTEPEHKRANFQTDLQNRQKSLQTEPFNEHVSLQTDPRSEPKVLQTDPCNQKELVRTDFERKRVTFQTEPVNKPSSFWMALEEKQVPLRKELEHKAGHLEMGLLSEPSAFNVDFSNGLALLDAPFQTDSSRGQGFLNAESPRVPERLQAPPSKQQEDRVVHDRSPFVITVKSTMDEVLPNSNKDPIHGSKDVEENVEKNDRTQRKTEDPALEQFQNEGTEIPQQGDFMDIDVSPDAQMITTHVEEKPSLEPLQKETKRDPTPNKTTRSVIEKKPSNIPPLRKITLLKPMSSSFRIQSGQNLIKSVKRTTSKGEGTESSSKELRPKMEMNKSRSLLIAKKPSSTLLQKRPRPQSSNIDPPSKASKRRSAIQEEDAKKPNEHSKPSAPKSTPKFFSLLKPVVATPSRKGKKSPPPVFKSPEILKPKPPPTPSKPSQSALPPEKIEGNVSSRKDSPNGFKFHPKSISSSHSSPLPVISEEGEIEDDPMEDIRSKTFSEMVFQLEHMAMESKLLKECVLETRVRLAIQSNKLLRLDHPLVDEKLRNLEAKAKIILDSEI